MDELSIRRAHKELGLGLSAVERGDKRVALEHFKNSANSHPTADAFTYWGWMEHHLGDTETAITLCKKAIALDPDFGNPYNDIGSYLIALNKHDEAISWLEKAKLAKRYESPQFPHINMGRIHLSKDEHVNALNEFEKALEFAPNDPALLEIIHKLRLDIN